MSSLRAEAEPLNNPGTFAAFSKLQRQLAKLETEEKILASAPPAPLTIIQRAAQQIPLAIQVLQFSSSSICCGCVAFSCGTKYFASCRIVVFPHRSLATSPYA